MSEQVDRYDVSCHCGAVDVRPKQDGHLVMYSDYAALERELAETEARECHLSGEMLQLAGMLNKANAELARYSMCAGQADQFAAEAKAVRKALGFGEASEDVAPVDLVDKITELMTKLDAVLAENVKLKGFIDDKCYTLGKAWETNGQVIDAAQSVPKTPATDAILNVVRAEGVEMFALYLAETAIKEGTDLTGWKSIASNEACYYADQLRAAILRNIEEKSK